jgi:hypothetical protein
LSLKITFLRSETKSNFKLKRKSFYWFIKKFKLTFKIVFLEPSYQRKHFTGRWTSLFFLVVMDFCLFLFLLF